MYNCRANQTIKIFHLVEFLFSFNLLKLNYLNFNKFQGNKYSFIALNGTYILYPFSIRNTPG